MPRRKTNTNSENISATESDNEEQLPVQSEQEQVSEESSEDFVENESSEEQSNEAPFKLPQINISVPKRN